MKVYVVRIIGGENLCVFSTQERAEMERRYLAALDPEDSLDYAPLDETKVEEHVLNLGFEDIS